MWMQTKSLSERQNEKARKALRELISRSFSSQRSAAEAFGVTPTQISDFLSGKRGAGPKLLMGVASVEPQVAAIMLGADLGDSQLSGEPAAAVAALVRGGASPTAATHAVLTARALSEYETREELEKLAGSLLAVGSALVGQR